MQEDFLLVHRSILPDYYEKVIETRRLIERENLSVTDACKQQDISRSTFYKYKDYVFYQTNQTSRKANVAFKVEDVSGVLSLILSCISQYSGNVLTINQDMPLRGLAYITILIDIQKVDDFKKVVEELKKLNHVKHVEVLAYE